MAAGAEIPAMLTAPDAFAIRLLVDGREVSSGTGATNPGDSPLNGLTFLANELCVRRGRPLTKGALVIAGHACQVAFGSRPARAAAGINFSLR